MHQHSSSEHAMQACIDACGNRYQVCLQTAMNHCLETGGKPIKQSQTFTANAQYPA
jgi:hypothetical protein